MWLACGGTLLAVGMGVATNANAGTLTFYEEEVYGGTGFEADSLSVGYSALPGETNHVVAKYDMAARTFTLTDTGALVLMPHPAGPAINDMASSNCTFSGKRVTCTHPTTRYNTSFLISVGDRNDSVSLTSDGKFVSALIQGGSGNDTLLHHGPAAWYFGGPGATLAGEEGNDLLRSGDGDDELFGGPGADRLDGGAGTDAATWDERFAGWSVTGWEAQSATAGVRASWNGSPDDGMPGEGDNLLDTVEHVYTTRFADTVSSGQTGHRVLTLEGDDRLQGGPGADEFFGGEGGDRIDGGGGDDSLSGGPGDDSLTGGPGADDVFGSAGYPDQYMTGSDEDVIDVRDGEADRYACDAGTDRVLADPFDAFGYLGGAFADDCETVEVEG
jgi:Ca2+-binding RTX toxin-like protein